LIKPGADKQNPFKNCEYINSYAKYAERDQYIELENINAGEYYIYCDISWDLSSS
jgi:hypothetical protein